MEYEVAKCTRYPDEWHVEAINDDGDGEIYVADLPRPDSRDARSRICPVEKRR